MRTSLERTAPESLTGSLTEFVPYDMSSWPLGKIQHGGFCRLHWGIFGANSLIAAPRCSPHRVKRSADTPSPTLVDILFKIPAVKTANYCVFELDAAARGFCDTLNCVAWSTPRPSGVGTDKRIGTSTRVGEIGANHTSMSRC